MPTKQSSMLKIKEKKGRSIGKDVGRAVSWKSEFCCIVNKPEHQTWSNGTALRLKYSSQEC